MLDEGFFSGPGSPPVVEPMFVKKSQKTKAKIKPLLKKVSVSSRNNSLDLSRSDGGLPNGVGLGIYDSQGYESSGLDDDTAFPKNPRRRHQRNISTASGSSSLIAGGPAAATPVQPFSHPKRQLPRERRVYTPDLSLNGTSNESSEEAEESDSQERETRRIVLSGSSRNSSAMQRLSLDTTQETVYENSTTSITDLHSYARARTPSVHLTSPISPVSPIDIPGAGDKPRKSKTKSRGRIPSTYKTNLIREPSPSFVASVTAARLAWEAKEEKKSAKIEQKRRRSEAKDEEKSRNCSSRTSNRDRGNSGSTVSQSVGTIWNDDDVAADTGYREKHPNAEQDAMDDDDEVYTGQQHYSPRTSRESKTNRTSRGANATGKKWGVLPADHPNPHQTQQKNGIKKRWLGFVVWVRIGMVRLGRKMGF